MTAEAVKLPVSYKGPCWDLEGKCNMWTENVPHDVWPWRNCCEDIWSTLNLKAIEMETPSARTARKPGPTAVQGFVVQTEGV